MSKRKASYSQTQATEPRAKKARMARSTTIRRKANNKNVAVIHSFPLPQKMKTRLRVLQNVGLISALTSSHALVFRPTSYFDVDPLVGGAAFAGYTFYSSAYGRYRVTSFKYKATFVNLEATAAIVSCQAIADSATPTVGTAVDHTEYAAENEYGQIAVCAPTTSSPEKILTGYVDCKKLWGTPEALTDNDWAGATGGSPTINSWLRIAAHMANNAAMTIGVQVILQIESYGYWDQKESDIGT